jgi:uncharacterized protein involved in exopolysaccharide biosynthesis
MSSNDNRKKDIVDLGEVLKTVWRERKTFYIVLPIVFVLSCVWIFPEPRYYKCDVALAPEGGEDAMSGLASVASSFGLNIGDMSTSDAIYPLLYPDLFESPEFIVGLFDIQVETFDGDVKTDYYTYLTKHQKKNPVTDPFKSAMNSIKGLFMEQPKPGKGGAEKINSFRMSKFDNMIVEKVKSGISCDVDKKTNVITISVTDQDPLVAALMADSVRERLQKFITDYRTKKVRQDVIYYQHLTDSARVEYKKAQQVYAAFTDSHRNVTLQALVEQGELLKNDMDLKLTTYNTVNSQLEAVKAKVQERTPSFTTLKSATVPVKAAGPKRILFIIGMLFLATLCISFWKTRKILFGTGSSSKDA